MQRLTGELADAVCTCNTTEATLFSPEEGMDRRRFPAILYAEDNNDEIVLMNAAFKRAKVKALLYRVKDGQEAIEYLEGSGKFADRSLWPLPRLVLLDLHMPRKSGLEVLQWIRQRETFCCMPVIIFSDSVSSAGMVQSRLLGANSVVVKPLSFCDLIEFVRSLTRYWLDFDLKPDAYALE